MARMPVGATDAYIQDDMVDEKYYLPDKTVEGYLRINERLGEHSLWRFRVTDKDGLARPVLTVSGTNLNFVQDDDMTDKIEYIGNLHPPRNGRETQEGMVYSPEGVSPAILATDYKGTMPKIITDNMQDKQVTTCAIRGRGESGNLHQSLEQGGEVANAVTTSHKDSMVMEIGNLIESKEGWSSPQRGRVYSAEGISPTLGEAMGMGGNQVPKVTEVGNIYPATGNPQAGRIYDEQGISPALDTMEGGNRQPKILTEEEGRQQALDEVRSNVRGKRDGKATAVLEEDGTIRGVHYPNGKDSSLSEHIVQHEDNPSMTVITANQPKVYGKSTKYRIRRLTPRECYRLMNVDEDDIDKIYASGISETRMYATAGNSIVVACLYHLFRKLFTQPDNEEQQLSLW